MKKEIKKPTKTKKEVRDAIIKVRDNVKTIPNYGEVEHPMQIEPEIPYGKMSAYPGHDLDKNWSREELEQSETIEEKFDKVLSFLGSIESELIELNNPKNNITLSSDPNSLKDMSWDILNYLHKQSADTLNRLNFSRRNQIEEEEFKFAEKRFNKLNEVLKYKLNQINWD